MDSLKLSDAAAGAVAVAPRVALADIEDAIASEIWFTVGEAAAALKIGGPKPDPLDILTLCAITMKNGFTVIGKSAPASAQNFNRDLGRKFAREDAVRQLWPLMGFALRDRLARG